MDTKENRNSSPWKKSFSKILLSHLLSYCLMSTQILLPIQAYAQEEESPLTDPNSAENLNAQRETNEEHVETANLAENGDLNSTCDPSESAHASTYDQYKSMADQYNSFVNGSRTDIHNHLNDSRNLLGDLYGAQEAFMDTDSAFAGDPGDVDPALLAEYEAKKADFIEKSNDFIAARDRWNAAKAACPNPGHPDSTCTAVQVTEYHAAQANYNAKDTAYRAAETAYDNARAAINEDGLDSSINGTEDPYFQKKREYQQAQLAYDDALIRTSMALANLNAAQAACADSFCTAAEQQAIVAAQAEYDNATTNQTNALNRLNAARTAYNNSPTDVNNTADAAWQDTAGNANAMETSHLISGCVGPTAIDVDNPSEDCTLGGPLFDADQRITDLANARINEAKELAAARADALFDMELQRKYRKDYELYELAISNGLVDMNLNDVDALDDSDPRKTKNLKLTISNIKTVGMASAALKDMVCEQHDRSEVDSQSYYVLRAAAATWLIAMVNNTDHYQENAYCAANDALTGDQNNEQVSAIERQAMLHDTQLASVCLRIKPQPLTPPRPEYDENNPDHWGRYGDTAEEAKRYVAVLEGYTDETGKVYPPILERCEKYYREIRGEEYADAPATREYALEMVQEAMQLAVEELAAKREKLAIAHANVEKGKAWVKRVQRDIMIMLALAAVVFAAYRIAIAHCAMAPTPGPMCPLAGPLNSKYVKITAVVVGIWLMSELSRAQNFLAEWEAKLEQAKFFHHMACNYEDAHHEADEMAALGQAAKERKEQEIREANNRALRGIYNDVQDGIDALEETPPAQESTFYQKGINEKLKGINNDQELIQLFSKVGREKDQKFKDFESIRNEFRKWGLELMRKAIPSATAEEVADTYENRRDVEMSATALHLAQGSESFRYFLVNRNQQFKNLTNDITNQPEHSPADTLISALSAADPKNLRGGVIKSINDLAAPFIGGDGSDPIADLAEDEKQGFPTPETRYYTIMQMYNLFLENIAATNTGLLEVAYDRDKVVELLRGVRADISMDDTGLSNTQLVPRTASPPTCLVGDASDVNFDPTCGCAGGGTCSSFEYPSFNPSTPNAFKSSIQLTSSTAGNLASGNLNGAALDGGKLTSSNSAVRGDLFQKRLNDLQKGKSGSGSFNQNKNRGPVTGNGQDINSLDEQKNNKALNALGVNTQNPNSSFGRLRNDLLNNGATDEKATKNSGLASNAGSKNSSRSGSSRRAKRSKSSAGEKSKEESFSLGEGNGGNLNLSGLSAEERAALGLSAFANGDASANGGSRDGHIRNISDDQNGSGKSKPGDSFYGINKDRKSSLFKIISKRYERTAFPILLTPAKN